MEVVNDGLLSFNAEYGGSVLETSVVTYKTALLYAYFD